MNTRIKAAALAVAAISALGLTACISSSTPSTPAIAPAPASAEGDNG